MAKEIRIKVGVKSNVIPVKVGIGQTVERIVAPEVYKGEYNIKPTGEDIIIPTKDKMLTDNMRIKAVGEWGKGTLVYEGITTISDNIFSVVTLPNGLPFSFDKLIVEIAYPNRGINSGWRQYWRSDLPMIGNQVYMVNSGVNFINNNSAVLKSTSVLTIVGDHIEHLSYGYNVLDMTQTISKLMYQKCDEYNKITAYGWWAFTPPIGTHIKITGYNRIDLPSNMVSST